MTFAPDNKNDYKMKFMKKSTKVKNAFVFPEMENLASTSHDDIVCVPSKTSPVPHTCRLSNVYRLSKNLDVYV